MKKNRFLAIAVVLAAAILFVTVDIQSVDEYYLEHIDDITPQSETVTLSIRCDTVLEHWEQLDPALQQSESLPKDGVILPVTQYALREGDTPFTLLDRVARHEKIQLEYQGVKQNSFGSVYVQGIQYLYEFSCGPTSGWVYRVNGVVPDYGCSQYPLQDGDVVEWIYTCDLGQDTKRGNAPADEGGVGP